MNPANGATTFPWEGPDGVETAQVPEFGLGLGLPLRNRRMTAPDQRPPSLPSRKALPTLFTLQSPFDSPPKLSFATLYSTPNPNDTESGFRLRHAIDLLEAVQAHPEEIYTVIKSLGNDNIRLQRKVSVLEQELKVLKENESARNEAFDLNVKDTVEKILAVGETKQYLLQACIYRLGSKICELRGGGQVIQGVWLNDEEYDAGLQDVVRGKTTWEQFTANKLAREQEGSISNASEETVDVKEKGKAMQETPTRRFNPNAVGLTSRLEEI